MTNPVLPSPPYFAAFPPDRFQILDQAGEGGMGQVFRAWDHQLDRVVALKLLWSQGPAMAQQLLLEAKYQASIQHPNVVPVHEVGLLDGKPCIAMAYISGVSLWDARGTLRQDEIVGIVAQAALGIHTAHRAGLIHRDLKPQNILVERTDETPHAYVTDFGLARATGAGTILDGGLVGTPHYFSPEQATGNALLDCRSDVFSLGATLYALLTGHPPFASTAAEPEPVPEQVEGFLSEPMLLDPPHSRAAESGSSMVEVLRRLLDEDPQSLRAQVPGLAKDLETIILHAMEKEPHRRYPTAQALAEDLTAYLEGRPIQARRSSHLYRLGTFARRNRALAWVSVSTVLLMVGAAFAFLLFSRRAQTQALLAQRFALEAQQIEHHVRLAHPLPGQDRRTCLPGSPARTQQLEREAFRGGPAARGALAFLKGFSLLQVGRPVEAQQSLEEAWRLGFQTSGVALALGEALFESRQRQLFTARAAQPLQDSRDPVLDMLRQARILGAKNPLLEARIATLEGHTDEALRLCQQAVEQQPWAYEARMLAAQIWLDRLGDAHGLRDSLELIDKAVTQLDQAIHKAPSDPRPLVMKAFAMRQVARRQNQALGQSDPAPLKASMEACDQAETVDPSYAPLFAHRALAMYVLANHGPDRSKPDQTRPLLKGMLKDARQAMSLDSEDAASVMALSWALEAQARRDYHDNPVGFAVPLAEPLSQMRELVRTHPASSTANLALAYILGYQEENLRERGQDFRAAVRETVQAYRGAVHAMNLRLAAQGELEPYRVEMAFELVFLAEVELAYRNPGAALEACQEAIGILEPLVGKKGWITRMPNDLMMAHLVKAEAEFRLGRDGGGSLREAERHGTLANPASHDIRPSRVTPYQVPLTLGLVEHLAGRDPRTRYREALAQAWAGTRKNPKDFFAWQYVVKAAMAEVRHGLGRGLEVGEALAQGQQGVSRYRSLEPKRSNLGAVAEALFHLARVGKPGTETWRKALANLEKELQKDAMLAADFREDLARWSRPPSS